ncbi:MAG: hypothetical protein C0409_00170 [Novosphingobium sp.]|nr:hypothetical protein [Novosphingobium sp.]
MQYPRRTCVGAARARLNAPARCGPSVPALPAGGSVRPKAPPVRAITTLAEGVEDAADLETLRREGCNMIQGYLISRPVCARDVATLLHSLAGSASRRAAA